MLDEERQAETDLRHYLRVLRRRRAAIVLVVVGLTGLTLLLSVLQEPVYAGKAAVVIRHRTTESLFNPNTGEPADPARAILTEIEVVKGEQVRALVREKLGAAPKVSVGPIGQTDVIRIRAESRVPARAAAIANAYAESYIEFRRTQAVEGLLSASDELHAKINELQTQIDQNAGSQREALVQQQGLFRQKLDQLQVDAALKDGGAEQVSRAVAEETPVRPRPVRNGIVAGMGGLLLGVACAFVLEFLDDSVKTKEDLERTSGLQVLGLIPMIPTWKTEGPYLVSKEEPTSPPSEAYRALRTAVQFVALDRPVHILQATSPNSEEGKTTTLANLAVALARGGQRVAVVCCDLRRPRIHEFFGLSNSRGFTSVLLGQSKLQDALQRVPGVDRLFLLASGPVPPNPSEILSLRRVREIFTSLQADGYYVLVDSPPVLPVTDSLVLSKSVDATVLVTVAGQTSRKEASRAVELLHQVNAPLIGAVLNGASAEKGYGYSYYYGYTSVTGEATNGHHGAANGSRKTKKRKPTPRTTRGSRR